MKTKYDLIVVGGGFAGTAAAIAAARQNVDVLLIERYNALGGAAANCLVMPFMPFSTRMPESNELKYLCGSIFLEVLREMNKFTGADKPGTAFDEEILKLVLNRMVTAAGVQLLYNTTVTEVHREDGVIRSVKVLGKSRVMQFTADYFIDATGDAELSYLAGCPSKVGREKDGLCQPMTLCFRMGGINKEKYAKIRSQITPLYKELQSKGLIRNPREDVFILPNFNDGVLHFNSTRIVRHDPTDPFDITAAEIEAREQAFELLNLLKENFEGFENARILSTALQIGIRESRKVIGEYTLTQEDMKALTRFPDGIATANYDIDIHNPEGAGTSHYYFGKGEWYEIPYRCLVPKGMNNLLVAGRCISSTHEAQASYRIMPFFAELGQAAGTAVAIAKETGTNTRQLDVEKVRTVLRREGFAL